MSGSTLARGDCQLIVEQFLQRNQNSPIVSLTQVPLRELLHREVVEADADEEDGREEDRRGFEGEFTIIHIHCACIDELKGM